MSNHKGKAPVLQAVYGYLKYSQMDLFPLMHQLKNLEKHRSIRV